jgi:CAAX protease family protein
MDEKQRRRLALLLGLGFEGGVGLFALGLGWLLDRYPLAQIHWTTNALLQGSAASLPLLIVFIPLWHWPIGPLARIERFMNEYFRPLFAPCTLLDLAVISALAGFGEELLFRGVLQGWLSDYLGLTASLVLSNLLFGLMHPITLTYVLLAAGIGVYLGWLMLATDNLLVPVVAHGLYDFIILVYMLRVAPPKSGKGLEKSEPPA